MKRIQLSIEGKRKKYLNLSKVVYNKIIKWLDLGKTLSSTSPHPLLGVPVDQPRPQGFSYFLKGRGWPVDLWTWVDSRTRLFLSFSSSVLVSAFESNFRSLCTETELFQRDDVNCILVPTKTTRDLLWIKQSFVTTWTDQANRLFPSSKTPTI